MSSQYLPLVKPSPPDQKFFNIANFCNQCSSKELGLKITGIASALIAIGTSITGLYFWDKKESDSRLFFGSVTLLSGGLYGLVASIVPRKYLREAEIYLADLSFEIFEIITQVYLNLTPSQTIKLGFYGVYNALGAFYTTTSVIQLATQPVKYESKTISAFNLQLEGTPLLPQEHPSTSHRIQYAIFKITQVALGIVAICFYYLKYPDISFLSDLGALCIGFSFGSILERGYHTLWAKFERENETVNITHINPNSQTITKKVFAARQIFKWTSGIYPTLLALSIVFNNIYSYTFAGLLIGGAKSFSDREFEKIKRKQDTQATTHVVNTHFPVKMGPIMKKVDRVVVGTLAVALVGWFVLAQVTAINIPIHIALACILGSIAFGYGITSLAGHKFEPGKSNWVINKLFFYFLMYHHWIYLPFIYITQKIEIGDVALNEYRLLGQIVTYIAYISLGLAVGQNRARQREKKIHPATTTPSVSWVSYFRVMGNSYIRENI